MAETPDSNHQDAPPVIPAPAATETKTPKKAKQPPSASGRGLAAFTLFLLIGIAGVGSWYGWQLWLQEQALERQLVTQANTSPAVFDPAPLERQLAELHQRYLSLEKAGKATDEQARQRLLEQFGRQLASVEGRVNAMSGTSRSDWKLAEAAFLLRMANQKVLLEHNSSEALAMCRAADAILKAQDDPGLFAVRQALTEEMMDLQMVEPVDKEGLYLRLQAVIEQVGQLPVQQVYQRHAESEPAASASADSDSAAGPWQTVQNSLANAWRNLGSLIRVTRHDTAVAPLMAPEQAYFLRQNLRLMLEQAQAALLRESQLAYRQSLEKAADWLRTYFELSDAAHVIADELAQLSKLPVRVDVPDVDRAQRLLDEYLERRHQVQSEDSL